MMDDFCKELVPYNNKLFTCGVTLGEGEAICVFCSKKILESQNEIYRKALDKISDSCDCREESEDKQCAPTATKALQDAQKLAGGK